MLLSPNGKILSRDNKTVLEVIRMCIQAYSERLNKILDKNVGKSHCISLANGFIKLVSQENNPIKKTLIDTLCLMEPFTEHIQPYPRLTNH